MVVRGVRLQIGVCLLVGLLLASALPGTAEEGGMSADDVVIAILDSGIRASHEAFLPGQVVAWRDFVNGRSTPYDDQGHGTYVASAAAGVGEGQLKSFAPGAKLAVAKVLSQNNLAYWSDLEAAIYWAVGVAGADIISISIYAYGPDVTPGTDHWSERLYDALTYARSNGALPLILAGNGAQNAGLPTMSYFHTPAASADALIVGGSGLMDLPQGSMEPEVTSDYTQRLAWYACDDCYRTVSGTSFSTPRVAGLAAALTQVARDEGIGLPVDMLETLLKRSAEDTAAPPTLEGYGSVGEVANESAFTHLRAGTMPTSTAIEANALYVESVQATGRDVWREGL